MNKMDINTDIARAAIQEWRGEVNSRAGLQKQTTPAEAKEFCSALLKGGTPVQIIALGNSLKAKETSRIHVMPVSSDGELEAVLVQAARLNEQGCNIYVEMNSGAPGTLGKRIIGAAVERVRAIVCDIDAKDGRSDDDCFAAVRDLPLKPTITVHTGGGYQCHWIFREPIEASADVVGRHSAVGKALALQVDGDSVYDTARMMRVPGFINWPDKKKSAAGRRPAEAVIAAAGSSRQSYTLDEVEKAIMGSAGHYPTNPIPSDPNADLTSGVKQESWFQNLPADDKDACLKDMLEVQGIKDLADTSDATPSPNWRTVLAASSRSGAPRARELCESWASTSARYNKDDFERRWFSYRKHEPQARVHVTIGTLIYIARQLGWDSSPWSSRHANVPHAATEPQNLEDMNARFAYVRMGANGCVVDRATKEFLKPYSFLMETNNRLTQDGKPLGRAWLNWDKRQSFKAAVFAPDGSHGSDELNLYRGFGVEPKRGNIMPWAQLLKALIPDKQVLEYVLKWLAYKVQNPAAVMDTILILQGAQGVGKDAVFKPILKMFAPHSSVIDTPDQIVGRFTGHLFDMLFVILTEAVFTQDPRQMDQIKARVTAQEANYEYKGQTPIRGKNHCAYALTTNHEHVWQATKDERRAVVIETSDVLKGNTAFWEQYHQWLDAGGAGHLLAALQTKDLTGFNMRNIPQSEALKKQQAMTLERLDPVATWWAGILQDGYVAEPLGMRYDLANQQAVPGRALKASYDEATRKHRWPSSWNLAMRRIHKLVVPGNITMSRPRTGAATQERVYCFPPLADMQQSFKAVTGFKPDEIDA